MRWLVFGTAGHVERPSPGGPLRHYNSCHGSMAYESKCLANMWHVGHPMLTTIHTCGYMCAVTLLALCAVSAAELCATVCGTVQVRMLMLRAAR